MRERPRRSIMENRVTKRRLRLLCGELCVSVFVFAAAVPSAASDRELGRYLSSECTGCHSSAQSGGAIPNIYGRAETTFADLVKAYRDKRLNNVVMQNVAARLNDEDIAALAAYFANAKPAR